MTTFLSFSIRTTVFPLEVYLQNLKSLRSLRNLPAFEAEGFEVFEICSFSEKCPKGYVFDVCEISEKQKKQKSVPKEYILNFQWARNLDWIPELRCSLTSLSSGSTSRQSQVKVLVNQSTLPLVLFPICEKHSIMRSSM